NIRSWGGETEGGNLPSNLYDRIAAIYLQPLRDPEIGLHAGRHSQVSRLIDRLTNEAQRGDFVDIAKDANSKIRELEPVKAAKGVINHQMTSIAGEQLTQKTELIFSDPTFHRIIAGLIPEIEGLPVALNGLGYNNLVFTSATLGTLRRSPQYSLRCILVEEPEAHLHPHLQVLLLRYLARVTAEEGDDEVQVIASSHSPILVSQAPIDSIVSVHEHDGRVAVVSVCSITMEESIKKKLQRFLDATRAELFFARRLLMVEGIAEVLLLPALTRIAGGCLKESAVTVLNADGINFNAFLPLLGDTRLSFPVAILTDGDAKKIGDPRSETATSLIEMAKQIPNLCIALSEITLEHELARSPTIFPMMLDAFEILHPIKGKELGENVARLPSAEDKANAFLEMFRNTKTSKGQFAQELAALLDTSDLESDAVPQYIKNALGFVGAIGTEALDG
ncbi:AAA family ATPase, partial [bacterium]|nr:AAA family ATPase [bacterium]